VSRVTAGGEFGADGLTDGLTEGLMEIEGETLGLIETEGEAPSGPISLPSSLTTSSSRKYEPDGVPASI